MTEQQARQPRPTQVTAAGLIVMIGSVFVVLLMWDRVAHLHTVDTQEALRAFLERSKLQDDGVDAGTMTTVVKVVSMISAALAVATAVQGWQVSKRSRSARVAVTILTIPLFLTGLVGDGFVDSAAATFWCAGVSAAVLTLWLGPARVWFGDVASPGSTGGSPVSTSATGGPGVSTGPVGGPPASAWAPPPISQYDVLRSPQAPPPTPPQGQSGPPTARPRALLWACVLTWVCTGLAITGLTLSLAMLAADSHSMLDEVYRQNPELADQGLSRHAVLTMLIILCAVVLAAAVAAAVFATLVFVRQRWAWYALLVSASVAAALFLIGAFGSPVAIVLLGACVATIACLVRPEVRAWVRSP